MKNKFAIVPVVLLLVASAAALVAHGQGPASSLSEDKLAGFTYRALGPYRAGSWVSDIAVPDAPQKSHLYTFYVAVRYGGVWKTTNNGTTFQPVFDGQDVTGIGCLAIAPSNENIVWVGTGDASSVRVAYPGDGVYKSIDAGRTWQRMGLQQTQHIGRIVVHPTNPDIVYVAAMGRLWSPNQERGVFKTTDGGKTWAKVLYVSDTTGAIDLVIDRRKPDTLYAAMYDVQRRPWRLIEGGTGSGIHKTTDGGRTWKKLGGGLPAAQGRIGLDIYQKNPNILYAVTENFARRPPTEEEASRDRARHIEPQPRNVGGEVYRTEDGGTTWRKANSAADDVSSKAGYSFNQIRVDQNNDKRIIVNCDSLLSSDDGGKTWAGLTWDARNLFGKGFGDFRSMWIDPQNSDRWILGSDGGVQVSYDAGKTCDHYSNIPGGEFYSIAVDMDDPYRIYGGLQDHDSWRGPIDGPAGRVGPEDWVTVGDNDGMYNRVDPTDSRWVYNTYQWGGHHRLDQRTHTRTSIVPTRPAGQPPLRWNWTPPLALSPFNSHILYTGAQVLFRSVDQGDHWQEISPDLTTNDAAKISPPGSTVQYGTITTIAESAVTPGVIWAGTDDGKVQVTRNHGASWTDVTGAVVAAGGGPDYYAVTRVLASRFAAGTAYVTRNGRRFDEFKPVVMKTTDFGATWTSLAGNLPDRAIDVIVEDVQDPDILFIGSNTGVYVSLDGGRRWTALKGNMPAVPVTDLVIHPRERDLIVATFGRGLYVANTRWLAEVKQGALDGDAHFFAVEPRPVPPEGAIGNYESYGDRHLVVPNDDGLHFDYFLKSKVDGKVTVTIADASGKGVRTLEGSGRAGLNRVTWDMTAGRGRAVAPGEYTVTIQAGGQKLAQKARVLPTGHRGRSGFFSRPLADDRFVSAPRALTARLQYWYRRGAVQKNRSDPWSPGEHMFDATLYTARRTRLQQEFKHGLLLFLGNNDAPMNYADNTYHFRQDSSFLYYWGLDDPELSAVIDVDAGRHTVYGNDFTIDDIVWRGPQPTIAERAAKAGVTLTGTRDDLAKALDQAVSQGRRIYFLPQYRADNIQALAHLIGIRAEAVNLHASVSMVKAVVAQRSYKGPEEIREIEAALEVAHDMHVLAMTIAKPGMYEREVAGAMAGLVESRGSQLSFPIIFSVHGETLHNHDHGNRMEAGQMAVNDSGADSPLHYASDITRTIPIGGRFVGPQRDLYQAVLRAHKKALAATRPGVKWMDVHLLACRSLAEDLKAIGCMKGDIDAAVQAGAHAMFFQCGLGHMMGFDVHDMEGLGEQHVGYGPTVTRSTQFGLKSLRMGRTLEPGFVMTVEPGIYMIPTLMDKWRAEGKFTDFLDYDVIDTFRSFGGIRVEDDVVVTETGCRVLGKPIPIEMAEVEALAR